jgi:hypothetical protein
MAAIDTVDLDTIESDEPTDVATIVCQHCTTVAPEAAAVLIGDGHWLCQDCTRQFIRVPRSQAPQYWHRQWAEVLAAAVVQEDGLSLVSPSIPRFESEPVRPLLRHDASPEAAAQAEAAFLERKETYEREKDHAYLRGDQGKTWLYQQNW